MQGADPPNFADWERGWGQGGIEDLGVQIRLKSMANEMPSVGKNPASNVVLTGKYSTTYGAG